MKRILMFMVGLFIMLFLFSCTSDEITYSPQERITDRIECVIDGTTIVITSGDNYAKKASSYEETETGYFYVRVDSRVPETADEETVLASSMVDYYPQTNHGSTDFDFSKMQKQVYPDVMGEQEYLLDAYGRYTAEAFAEDAPTMEDVIASFKRGKLTYHGETIYDPSTGVNKLDGYKVIWYVVKRIEDKIHVDGALVPIDQDKAQITDGEEAMKEEKGEEIDKTDESKKDIEEEKKQEEEKKDNTDVDDSEVVDIVIPIEVPSSDIVLEADDFTIRKSGIDEYVAYEKVVNANTLEYNGVTITRGRDMKLKISGLNNLDWSEEGTIWTFDTYLWAKFDLIPTSWAMEEDVEYIIDNDTYNIEVHYYTGFQSNGTVPYIKVSVHVEHK